MYILITVNVPLSLSHYDYHRLCLMVPGIMVTGIMVTNGLHRYNSGNIHKTYNK